MKEENIDWSFVKKEIVFKGCGIGIAFGKLALESEEYKHESKEYLNHPNLIRG